MNRCCFDLLPPEIKLNIIERGDPVSASRVSKEWRALVRNSKKLMQTELDKYFFFFIFWVVSPETTGIEHPIPGFVPAVEGTRDFFVFPISTEEQFYVLKSAETARSQVAALERNSRGVQKLLFLTSRRCFHHFFYDLDTEALTLRIKESGEKVIPQYIREICRVNGNRLRTKGTHLFFPPTPQFSNKRTMASLLQREHKAILNFSQTKIYYILPKDYDTLETTFETLFPSLTIRRRKLFAIYSNRGFDETDLAIISYTSLLKSLFVPQWGAAVELTPARYAEFTHT